VLNHGRLASSQSPLAQVWKEYALSDSRYLTTDPFTLCVEAVTVVRLHLSRLPHPVPLQKRPLTACRLGGVALLGPAELLHGHLYHAREQSSLPFAGHREPSTPLRGRAVLLDVLR